MIRILSLVLAATLVTAADNAPRIAVWDPGAAVETPRISIDTAWLDRIATWIGEAGLPTARLDSAAIASSGGIDPATWPVLVLPGDVVPRADIAALSAYADHGGILLGLSARVPFNNAIAPGGKEAWRLDPEQPKFAWETRLPRESLGIRYIYNPDLHDQGICHEATALFKRYLPEATIVRRRLPHAWLCRLPEADGPATRFIPLIDSTREDGASVVPAIYVAVFGRRTSIMCTQSGWTGRERAPWWPHQRATVQALARFALDLAQGRIDLTGEPTVALVADPAPPAPGTLGAGVDPDRAEPVARFGVFDGSSRGMAPAVATGTTQTLATGAAMPRGLQAGSRLILPLPPLGQDQTWLRIRLGFSAGDAGLSATIGGLLLLNERFLVHDASGVSNNHVRSAQPVEINRIVCIPPDATGDLVLGNPGSQEITFDAVQIERRPQGTPGVLVGFNASMGMTQPGGSYTVPPALGRTWGAVRQTLRLQYLGEPGDPQRWAKVDQVVEQAVATGAPVHAILEGCPSWMATPDTYAEAVRRKRPHICVPRLDAWAAMLEELVPRYRGRIAAWELWNEVDITQFWIGTPEEYVDLWKTTLPILHRLDPGSPVFTGGLARQAREVVDAFVDGGLTAEATWIANHCYAGQSPMWEAENGQLESMLYARGVVTPIHANEQGFVYTNAEWFTGPPPWTRDRQARATDIALARLMAAGHVRVSVFTCGGDAHPYGYLDAQGGETPAYRVVADYMALNGPDARREDVCLTAADGSVLAGIYAAAARHQDGTQVVVLNPSEAEQATTPVRLALALPDDRPRQATITQAGATAPVVLVQHGAWAELRLDLGGRALLRITP
jgi:hypothetical protein